MKIISDPTRCVLFFDMKIGGNEFNVELDQTLPSGDVKVKAFYKNGDEMIDQNIISVITKYLTQKYDITYENSNLSDKGQSVYHKHNDVKLDPPI